MTKRWWMRFVWSLFPKNYRRDIGINLLRAHTSWLDDNGFPRDKATVLGIIQLREDLSGCTLTEERKVFLTNKSQNKKKLESSGKNLSESS